MVLETFTRTSTQRESGHQMDDFNVKVLKKAKELLKAHPTAVLAGSSWAQRDNFEELAPSACYCSGGAIAQAVNIVLEHQSFGGFTQYRDAGTPVADVFKIFVEANDIPQMKSHDSDSQTGNSRAIIRWNDELWDPYEGRTKKERRKTYTQFKKTVISAFDKAIEAAGAAESV